MAHQKKLSGLLTAISFFILLSSFGQKNNSQNPAGTWVGKSSPDSFSLSFRINFEKSNNRYKATYSSDEQRASDIPLQKVTYDSIRQSVTFALVGDADSWNFTGKIKGNMINRRAEKLSDRKTIY